MASLDDSTGSESAVGTTAWSLGDLELELVRIRSELRAARLEARAAEIELQARRLRNAGNPADAVIQPQVAAAEIVPQQTTPTDPSAVCELTPRPVEHAPAEKSATDSPFVSGWEGLAAAAKRRRASSTVASASPAISLPQRSAITGDAQPVEQRQEEAHSKSQMPQTKTGRHDAGHPTPNPPVHPRPENPKSRKHTKGNQGTEKHHAAMRKRAANPKTDAEPRVSPRKSKSSARVQTQGPSARSTLPSQMPTLCDDSSPAAECRRRPAAWLMSTLAHILVLLLLAALTLSTPDPQDQLALSASAVPAASEELEPLTIEPMESADEPSEQELAEEAVEIDPLGDLTAPPPVAVQPPAASSPDEAMALSDPIDTAELLLPSDTEMTTEFCGVAGGGNHFCYIVDSSQSMKNGRFDSARAELLQSIEQLKDDQRFYVIFYDVNLDRMCISDPAQPDAYSVNATVENKRALRRWAMQIGLERGAPPGEALEFAFTLRPDAIFLLSDGEFPQRIEELVAELNRKDSLFGDQGPRSILHTIGYHSRDGEARMRRLAEANGGQYHYVPRK